MAKYTVVGGQGFIGAEIVKQLEGKAHDVLIPEKNDSRLYSDDLGIIIYCAGHGDCKNNPLKVFQANSGLLASILERSTFERLVYVSSTRLYLGQDEAFEKSNLTVLSKDNRRLFNLTKLVSEELCLSSHKNVVIVRPSNVYGLALTSPLFLPSITRNAIKDGKVNMYVTPNYSKDYVSVIDVADGVIRLSCTDDALGQIINIASGTNTPASSISELLIQQTGCEVEWHSCVNDEYFPNNDISKIKSLIDFEPSSVLNDIRLMTEQFKKSYSNGEF